VLIGTITAHTRGGLLPNKLVELSRLLYSKLITYALKFGIIGLLCYVIDVGIFNMLRLGVFGTGHFFEGPLGAKIISVSVATVLSWYGNRYWTFREHRRSDVLLELAEFAAVSVGGLLLQLGCLGVSHYLLGHTSLFADNISSNVIGLVLGTGFRFVLYRFWVYGSHRTHSRGHVSANAQVTL
jgi:putative flippase GtrA